MIPKVIHYCWFGGKELPKEAVKCIESWKKFCPDYEIIEWNENNFDVKSNQYVFEAFQSKKWAFITDYVRLYVLVKYGGFYMDTDVELIKSLNSLLDYHAVSGFENNHSIHTGLMACEKGFPLFDELLHEYDDIHFIKNDGSLDLTTNVERITNTCKKYGLILNDSLQIISNFTLLPHDYLCPKDHSTGRIHLTKNTICIHHFAGSWVDSNKRLKLRLIRLCYAVFGEKFTNYLRRIFGKTAKGDKR